MLITGERQELLQIERELRESGRGFTWQLTLHRRSDSLAQDRPQPDGTDLR